MGEGTGTDELIMPFINAANIACGYHAGDSAMMWQTVELAISHWCTHFIFRQKKFWKK
jgi:lactam utilization protein B